MSSLQLSDNEFKDLWDEFTGGAHDTSSGPIGRLSNNGDSDAHTVVSKSGDNGGKFIHHETYMENITSANFNRMPVLNENEAEYMGSDSGGRSEMGSYSKDYSTNAGNELSFSANGKRNSNTDKEGFFQFSRGESILEDSVAHLDHHVKSADLTGGKSLGGSRSSSAFDPADVLESDSYVMSPSMSHSLFAPEMNHVNLNRKSSIPELLSLNRNVGQDKCAYDDSVMFARRVTVNDMASGELREQHVGRHSRPTIQKATSAPVVGSSSIMSSSYNFSMHMGNTDWDLEPITNRRGSMPELGRIGLLQRDDVNSAAQSDYYQMNRVRSEGSRMWGSTDERHRSRSKQQKKNFLTLNRPKKTTAGEKKNEVTRGRKLSGSSHQNPQKQYISFDGSSSPFSNVTMSRPWCEYVDFSLIDDTQVTDETPIYGQTYESILRNPDVSIVQDKDVVVVPAIRNIRTVPTFPKRLMNMLCRPDVSDAIAWLPHGRSFMVKDPKKFEESVYPLFFKPAKYKSFQRQLNLWKFIRINKGFDAGSYYHALFLRGKPHLVKKIILPKNEETDRRSSNPNRIEPDFHELAKLRPLPEESPSTTPFAI